MLSTFLQNTVMESRAKPEDSAQVKKHVDRNIERLMRNFESNILNECNMVNISNEDDDHFACTCISKKTIGFMNHHEVSSANFMTGKQGVKMKIGVSGGC